ncbi:hypothetical protein [Rhodococcus zopfii]|uniref:hypothetical protein n=1 Tax=Rhodococcus zopfii TaxID=43772 RepID=UPI0011112B06|nr:hypothetical protein [Rhodococcus zopfii]
MPIPKIMDVKQVMAASKRGEARVRNAANSGALTHLPRDPRGRFFFTEEAVAEWILQGSPELPPRKRSRRFG